MVTQAPTPKASPSQAATPRNSKAGLVHCPCSAQRQGCRAHHTQRGQGQRDERALPQTPTPISGEAVPQKTSPHLCPSQQGYKWSRGHLAQYVALRPCYTSFLTPGSPMHCHIFHPPLQILYTQAFCLLFWLEQSSGAHVPRSACTQHPILPVDSHACTAQTLTTAPTPCPEK